MNTGQLSQDTGYNDAIYVNWHLLEGCNHYCEYNHEPESAIHEHFSREIPLEAAYRLLSLNRPEYIFHIYGGEPTIHPYFPDLLKYIVTSGRNVHILLDTNGLRSHDYYKQILKGIPKGRLCVRIDVHCKYTKLEQLLVLIALIVEGGQYCRVNLNHIPAYADKAHILYEKLLEFRHTIPFALHMSFPLGGSADWQHSLQASFAAICEPQFAMPIWAPPTPSASVWEYIADGFSCMGAHSVHVEPDGVFTLGLHHSDQPFTSQVMEDALLRPALPPAPCFASAEEAHAWLEAFRVRALRYELDGGAVRHPLHTDMDEEQQLRVRLKRLNAASSYRRKRPPQPALWQERKPDVLRAFACLKDEDSRTVFLRCLKAQLLGDSGYLVRSAYAQFAHPRLGTEFSPEDPACRLIRLADGVSTESVTALTPRLQWYQPALELVLPSSSQWIDIMLTLHEALPDYQLFLGQHGMQTVLYGLPSSPRKRYLPVPPRTVDGQPLVSVILAASADRGEDGLRQSIESVLAQALPRYELIVVQGADDSGLNGTLDDFVRQTPWAIRPFRLEGSPSFTTACDAGLDMAQGEYVCFLHAGDTLLPGALTTAIHALEAEQADVAVASPAAARSSCIEGAAVLTRFLIGQSGDNGTRGKVYRATLIHDYAITFASLPEQMEDDLFNLPFFYFAQKAVSCAGKLAHVAEGNAPPAEQTFQTFLANLNTLTRFCTAHGLGMEHPEVRAYVLRQFREIKPDFFRIVREASSADTLDTVLDATALAALANMTALMQNICEECIAAYCSAHNLSAEPITALPSSVVRAYQGAAGAFEMEYPLSIIITVDEGAALYCLERLMQEDCSTVECVVIDNATPEKTAVVLEGYADMYPNFRLFRMKEKVLEPQCRNAGLLQASGKSVTFMRSGDELLPDVVDAAITAMADASVDIAVFGVQRVDADGLSDFPFMNADAQSGPELAAFMLEKGMPLDTMGMVFRHERLTQRGLTFNPASPVWHADFTLRALRKATVRMCPESACVQAQGQEPPLLVGTPESLDALYDFYMLLQELAPSCSDAALSELRTLLARSLTQEWLPLCSAAMRAGRVPFTEHAMDTARRAPLFLRILLSECAHSADAE